MELFDTHAHLDFSRYKQDRDQVLKRASAAGVTQILNVGADLKSSHRSVNLADNNAGVFAAVGVHPHEASTYDLETAKELNELARAEKVVAVGETGLDYHYDNSPRSDQRQAFRSQLRLAQKLDMPVIIHSREAEEDTLDILQEEWQNNQGAVVHCYSSSKEMAKELVKKGFYLGFTGLITFSNLEWLRRIVSATPLEQILIETDSPYMSPEPERGKRNEPARVKFVASQVGECHNISCEKAARVTADNGRDLFSISQNNTLSVGD